MSGQFARRLHFIIVIAGLDPAIHPLGDDTQLLDPRIKSGGDDRRR
jgi:hypothetical protein